MQIELENLSASLRIGPIRSPLVLKDINLKISSGSFTAIVGHTGAGKSSLLKTLNGLLIPEKGKVLLGDQISIHQNNDKKDLKAARQKVGMVFQFPENQLFAETVEKDICFGPLNFGVSFEEATQIAKNVIVQVGLNESILKKSPFSLSGGQKRRVAIAGILAMNPDILVLDEPGAGLDPQGKREILTLIKSWNRDKGLTTLLVTHDMEDVALYAEQAIVMDKGQIAFHGGVRELFSDAEQLQNWHIDVPDARRMQLKIEQAMDCKLPIICLTEEELANALIEVGIV